MKLLFAFLLFSVFTFFSCEKEEHNKIPLSGLVVYYKFDGGIKDYSGNNYHITNTNLIYGMDRFNQDGKSIELNGINQAIELASDFDYNEKTISVWFYAEDIPVFDYELNPNTSWRSIVTSDYPGLENGSINLAVSKVDGTNKVWFYSGGMDYQVNPEILSAEIEENQWYHIAVTLSKDIIRLYLNGKLINSSTATFVNSVNGLPYMILGAGRWKDNRFFDGRLDDFLLYNRVLSKEEIYSIYDE